MTTESGLHSAEERFLGVKTTITKSDETPPDAVVEVVDDRPPEDRRPAAATTTESSPEASDDELASYSEKVQRRIKRMTWEKNEERRAREAAERMREEAVRFAQQLAQRNQYYEQLINNGEGVLVEQVKANRAMTIEQVKALYRKAYEEGDTEGILKAQEALNYAQNAMKDAVDYDANYRQRLQQQQAQQQAWQQAAAWQAQQARRPVQPVIPKPTERAQKWATDNPWFGKPEHKDMTALAYGIHERLVREEGYAPDSEEYFAEIDREMRNRFADYFDSEQGSGRTASAHRSPTTVVASGDRNNSAKPRRVKLTSTQVALAKRLGLTPEQYARQVQLERGT